MKTKLLLLFVVSLVLFSCNEKNDEPLPPTTKDVTIVALTRGNTLYSMSTSDGQVKTTTIDSSYGDLNDLFMHNGDMMLFSKASDGFRMMKFDGNSIVDSRVIDWLNDYIGGYWWVSVSNTNNSYNYVCSNYSEEKYVIIDENGNSKEFSYKLNGDITSYMFRYDMSMVDGNGNFYYAYYYSRELNPSGYWIVEKNGQKLYQVNGKITPLRMCIAGNDVYLLGYNSEGKGAYAVNSNVIVDEGFSTITCASVLNGQLCLGGFKTDEYNVDKATMKIGGKYYDLTDELGWYEHKDTATGAGNNHSSNVERFLVENNEIFALVRKFNQVNPLITGGDDYFLDSGDAIFRNTHKVMDLGDKLIRSFVVLPLEK